MVLLGAAGILTLTACEIRECEEGDTGCTSGVGGNGGEGGEGGTGGTGATGGMGGTGGAGGGGAKGCACANYITDPAACPDGLRPESVAIYNEYFDCICGTMVCGGTDAMTSACADNVCDTAGSKGATPECETCRVNASMSGNACYDTFSACGMDSTD